MGKRSENSLETLCCRVPIFHMGLLNLGRVVVRIVCRGKNS